MIYHLKCDRCGCKVDVDYSVDEVASMREYGYEPESLLGRCDACQDALMRELGYKASPQDKASPPLPPPAMTQEQLRERLPLAMRRPPEELKQGELL